MESPAVSGKSIIGLVLKRRALGDTVHRAEPEQVPGSRAAQTALAENDVGLPC